MAETPGAQAEAGGSSRFLTFSIDTQSYAIPAGDVAAIIRSPTVARIPQAPRGLLGVANLRGTVLPLASVRGLLGRAEVADTSASRAIVLQGAAPVALAVDAVEGLVAVSDARIETRQSHLAESAGERLIGTFRLQGDRVARLIDIKALLAAAFVQPPRAQQRPASRQHGEQAIDGAAGDLRAKLVAFDVAEQEYGLELSAVQEIIAMPGHVAAVARADAVVLGVTAYRETVLPLLSLRGLLGLGVGGHPADHEKIVVTLVGGVMVGLVTDRMKGIIPIDETLVDPIPPLLAARAGGEARIKAIYRGEDGKRLISVLAPEQLFREDVVKRLGGQGAVDAKVAEATNGETLQFLVFRLGDEEFGLPIETVSEVARLPDQISRLPKAPKFLEGLVNLRGEVLPVIDQRRRFDMPPLESGEGRRLIVVKTERHRAGLIVDAVTEVLRASPDQVEAAPNLTGESTGLVHGVLNLEASGRIVLLLNPAELLTRTERGLLDAFAAADQAAG